MDAVWAAWDGPGLEHLWLEIAGAGVRADSLLIAVDAGGRPFRARFVLECDAGWRLRRARIEQLGPTTGARELRADGRGGWSDETTGAPLALAGCLDIDVYPSPFTNTLPIRRLGATLGEPVALNVAFVALPDLQIRPARQEYTLLERREGGARWRFRSLDSGFRAELTVDRHGLVLDYPGIARRLR